MFTVTVEGGEALSVRVRAIGAALSGPVLEAAAQVGAEVLLGESRRIVPVDTGNLRASLTQETTESTPSRATVAVGYGKQAPYGRYVELGTYRMRAQPFLRPPITTHGAQAVSAAVASLRRQLDRVA